MQKFCWSKRNFFADRLHSVRFIKLACILLVFGPADLGHTQQAGGSLAAQDPPNALDRSTKMPGAKVSHPEASSSISGTVLDANGGIIPGANVTLTSTNDSREQTLLSGSSGEFSFDELPAGTFTLTIKSPGMQPYTSPDLALRAGEKRELHQISMHVAGTMTEVQVVITKTELAQEQVKAAERQRVFGVLPNFYSSYIWGAEPLNTKQKFDLAIHSVTDPIEFLATGIVAGAEQAADTFPGYGQGAAGYAKRYGAAYADEVLGRLIGSAILPSLLHQDPRYFYKGSGSARSRMLYAVSRAFVTRGDDGRVEANYSGLLGSFAAGGLANLYYPPGDRGLGLTLSDGAISIAGHAVDNLIREFVLRRLTPNVPVYERGKP